MSNQFSSHSGRGGVQHREGPSGPNPEAEDYGVLWEEGETDRATEENVSHGETSRDAACLSFFVTSTALENKGYGCVRDGVLCNSV